MVPTSSIYARHANTPGSRVSDPNVARYLLTEYRGGMTVEELLADEEPRPSAAIARVRAAVARFVTAVLLAANRLKPTPAAAGA